MAAEHAAVRIRKAHVQVHTVGGNAAGQAEQLQVTHQLPRVIGAGQAKLRDAHAADAGPHEGRAQVVDRLGLPWGPSPARRGHRGARQFCSGIAEPRSAAYDCRGAPQPVQPQVDDSKRGEQTCTRPSCWPMTARNRAAGPARLPGDRPVEPGAAAPRGGDDAANGDGGGGGLGLQPDGESGERAHFQTVLDAGCSGCARPG